MNPEFTGRWISQSSSIKDYKPGLDVMTINIDGIIEITDMTGERKLTFKYRSEPDGAGYRIYEFLSGSINKDKYSKRGDYIFLDKNQNELLLLGPHGKTTIFRAL